jgi:hypothetical protein
MGRRGGGGAGGEGLRRSEKSRDGGVEGSFYSIKVGRGLRLGFMDYLGGRNVEGFGSVPEVVVVGRNREMCVC